MRLLFFTFLFMCIYFHSSLNAQNFSSTDPEYIKNVKLGEAALKSEKWDSCLIYYQEGFKIKQTSVLSTLRMAACAFSGGHEEVYEAQMEKAFELNWAMAKAIVEDYPEFDYLASTPFEKRVEEVYKDSARLAGLDLDLMGELDEIGRTDQAQRREMGPISEKYGWESPQMDSLWKIQNYSDSINTIRICEIIDERGYPGKSLVSTRFQGTAFLVIQHADLNIQEKYLPIIKEAANNGEVRWSSVALLIDRVRQRQGKKQIYGSQVSRDPETNEYFFGEIEEPYKVDSLRASVGLGPLTEYASRWEFNYDPDQHVARHKKRKEAEGMKNNKSHEDKKN